MRWLCWIGSAVFSDTLTILRYPTTTDHGATVPNLAGVPTTTTVRGCDAQPVTSQELSERRESSRVAWQVWAPAGTDVLATDHAKLNGAATIYRVVGEPQRWAGELGSVVVQLEVWRG